MVLLNFEFRVFFFWFGINLQQLGNLAVNKMHVNVFNNARIKFTKFSESKIISPPFRCSCPYMYKYMNLNGKENRVQAKLKVYKVGVHQKSRTVPIDTQRKTIPFKFDTNLTRTNLCEILLWHTCRHESCHESWSLINRLHEDQTLSTLYLKLMQSMSHREEIVMGMTCSCRIVSFFSHISQNRLSRNVWKFYYDRSEIDLATLTINP